MGKPVTLRRRAHGDIRDAVGYYTQQGGVELAKQFLDALEAALDHLANHPMTGSLRYAYELDIPDLRSWRVRTFPYLVFYVDRRDDVDVWRLLHGRRDVRTSLADGEGELDR